MAEDTAVANKSAKRQMIAGALTTVFSYAALVAVLDNPVKTLISGAHWQQAPLHLVFALTTACIGMAAMAGYDRYSRKVKGQADTAPGPKPD